MKNCLLFILLIKISVSMNAQSTSWTHIDSCSSTFNVPVKVKNNDIYTVGNCNEPLTYTNGMFSSTPKSIIRMSSSGNYKRSTGNFQRLENFLVDNSGNIYAVGRDTLIDHTFNICCKFDSIGNLLWHFPIGTTWGVNVNYTILVSDGFVFGGEWINTAWSMGASFNLFIAKADFNGNLKFLHKFDNYNTGRIDKIIESGNNIFVSGSFSSYITISDSVNSITLNGFQGYLAKFTSHGNLVSANAIPKTVCTFSMAANPLGNIVFGNWQDTVGLVLYTYTDTGALISSEHIADAGIRSQIKELKFDLTGNLYIGCWFEDSITLNNTQTFHSQDLDAKSILFRRNTSGINDWTLYPNCPDCYGNFDLFSDCDLVFNAFYWDSIEVLRIHHYNSYGNILMRLNCEESSSIPDINFESGLEVFPNPSSGIFTINLKNTTVETQICIYDVLGNCLWNQKCQNETKPKIDLSSRQKGIYFMEIVSGDNRSVNKIVLQ